MEVLKAALAELRAREKHDWEKWKALDQEADLAVNAAETAKGAAQTTTAAADRLEEYITGVPKPEVPL